jgi:hypothetical protein
VYGLDDRWQGPRWFDFFEALHGEPAWAVWLGHRADGKDAAGVRVGTLHRQRYDMAKCPRGGDPLAEVAFSAAFGLVNLTLPDVSVPRPDGLIAAMVEHAEAEAAKHDQWSKALWEIDGKRVPASVWSFAGAWAGFTEVLPEAYIAVVGIGVHPSDLRLVRVTDAAAYAMRFDAPLDLGELGRRKYDRPESWLPPPQRDRFHPDQLALLPNGNGQDPP